MEVAMTREHLPSCLLTKSNAEKRSTSTEIALVWLPNKPQQQDPSPHHFAVSVDVTSM